MASSSNPTTLVPSQQRDYGQPVQHEETSCGLLLFRKRTTTPPPNNNNNNPNNNNSYEFLLMKHSHRLDLPKGRMEPGESYLQTASREFSEETSLPVNTTTLSIHPRFEFVEYYSYYSHRKKCRVGKTLRMYLAFAKEHVDLLNVKPTEHGGFQWMEFDESKKMCIQKNTIDPLLRAIQKYLKDHSCGLKELHEESL
ncbi:hypothetical protein FDP41_001592 [Naegleria fowleri]|uniref:Nudix hydrolase domain-containing protein n=1 Tax=Naegleria fowleri TaxID=5763 RepID=A0A6A5C1Y6_NAEFO|nr:uncharacterized protein FDP41_001592 [Naegleria fowleri]KAF0979249.1 hypothetical protein FDP41_001592 [Naegleria fowleri]